MTEYEYQIKILCCTPKELLIARLKGSKEIPEWLCNLDNNIIKEALDLYETPKYTEMRDDMLRTL